MDTQRFLDAPPESRNGALASLMRRVRICEERDSGIDKVIEQVERFQLPAPFFEVPPGPVRQQDPGQHRSGGAAAGLLSTCPSEVRDARLSDQCINSLTIWHRGEDQANRLSPHS